jgi:hypothetical protein
VLDARYGNDTRLHGRFICVALAVTVSGQHAFALNGASQDHHISHGKRKGDGSAHKEHNAQYTDGAAGQAVELPFLVAAVES